MEIPCKSDSENAKENFRQWHHEKTELPPCFLLNHKVYGLCFHKQKVASYASI